LADVRRADAVCSQYRRRNGVAFRFQVSANKVVPAVSNRCCNLFANKRSRSSLAEEPCDFRPEVARVVKPLAFARCGEGRAGTACCPNFAFVGPSGKVEGKVKEAAAAEQMDSAESHKLAWLKFLDVTANHLAVRNRSGFHGFPHDLAFQLVEVVVESPFRHVRSPLEKNAQNAPAARSTVPCANSLFELE
jgi:hypothetical protein